MIQRANNGFSPLDTICRQADERLSHLTANMKNIVLLRSDLNDLQVLLKCVPPGSDDYEKSIARINNAQRYLQSSEEGAARYEIRQLIRSLHDRLRCHGHSSEKNGWIGEDSDEPSQNAVPVA